MSPYPQKSRRLVESLVEIIPEEIYTGKITHRDNKWVVKGILIVFKVFPKA
jgi:hypothetical protein